MKSYGSTNATPGYAKVSQYGSQGIKPIIPPTPSTLNPAVLAFMKPHSLAYMMSTPSQKSDNTPCYAPGGLSNKR